MISKITYNTNRINSNKVSFGSCMRSVYDQKGNIVYKNNTYMFRHDLDWEKVTDHILSKNGPQNIYCFACSDGSEPFSIAIALISKLGYAKAQKYFPILAIDIDERMISMAQKGQFPLVCIDLDKLKKYQQKSDIKLIEKIENNLKSDDFGHLCTMSRALRKCIEFRKGNIVNEAKNADYNNSVVFCRNVWPYLSKEDAQSLGRTFSERFSTSTSFIKGNFDDDIPEKVFNEGNTVLHKIAPNIFEVRDKALHKILFSIISPNQRYSKFRAYDKYKAASI